MGGGRIMDDNEYGIPYIVPFDFWVQHIIPLTYDDSLSYLEVLEKVKVKLNEVINNINSWSDNIKNYTDSQIAGLKSYVDQQDTLIQGMLTSAVNQFTNQIQQLKVELQNENQATRKWVEEQINQQIQNMVDFQLQVNKSLNSLRLLIYQQDNLIYLELEKQVNRLEEMIKEIQINPVQLLIDPVDGKVKNIQEVINNLYYTLKVWSLTALEYDMLMLTAEQYDNYQLTAWEYDYLSRWFLKEKPEVIHHNDKAINTLMYMHSPFTGNIELVKKVVNDSFGIIRYAGITAEQYDNAELTAQEYGNLNLTAYQYDWYGLLIISPEEKGLTAQEYDNMFITNNVAVSYLNL